MKATGVTTLLVVMALTSASTTALAAWLPGRLPFPAGALTHVSAG